jgi:hypothetical protein
MDENILMIEVNNTGATTPAKLNERSKISEGFTLLTDSRVGQTHPFLNNPPQS